MKKTFCFCCIVALIAYGCKKSGGDPPLLFPTVLIHYVDTTWHDLITDGQNGYFLDSILLYDYQNGVRTKLSSPSKDYPNGFQPNTFFPRSGIDLGFFNMDVVNRYTVTLIHLKMGVEDTLKFHLKNNLPVEQNGFDSAWYNGTLTRLDTFSIMKRH